MDKIENDTSIAHNSFKAFEYFEKYAYHHTNINSKHVYASDVAEAFVALGKYHLAGIPETRLKQNPSQAFIHFKHAATILRDADASYHLARLYLTGKGVPKNLLTAAKYLKRAYQKNHAAAQAVLGNLFWDGKGVNRNKGLALILLLLANENSDDPNCPGYESSSKRWISKAYDRMLDKVDPTKKIIAQTKFEDLYHPCNGGKALKPIDGIKIDYESDELDQQNNLENIPNRKLDEKSPATQPMTFQ